MCVPQKHENFTLADNITVKGIPWIPMSQLDSSTSIQIDEISQRKTL